VLHVRDRLLDVSQEAKDHLVHLYKRIYELADSDEPTLPDQPAKVVDVDFQAQAQSD
jgi:hypothetical protein